MCKFSNNDIDGYYEEDGILVYPSFDITVSYPTADPLDFTHCQKFICYAIIYKGKKYIVEPEVVTHDLGNSKTLIYHELDTEATATKVSDRIKELMLEDV